MPTQTNQYIRIPRKKYAKKFISFTEGITNFVFSEETDLNLYDKEVHSAIISLFVDSNRKHITRSMVQRAMAGNRDSFLSPNQSEKLDISIRRCLNHQIVIDEPDFKYNGNLINGEIVNVKLGGTVVEGLHVIDTPILYTYALQRNQIAWFDIKMLDSPINKTRRILILQSYLISRVACGKRNGFTETILCADIFNHIGLKGTTKQSLESKKLIVMEQVRTILNYWVSEGFINGYQEGGWDSDRNSVTIRA